MRFNNQDQKLLAIDFGTKRIGLAVSQGPLAVPLEVIHYQDETEAIRKITEICAQQQITQVILGLSEKETAVKTRRFGQKLQSKISQPIIYSDETLSSQEVEHRFKLRKKPLPKEIDHYAAAYILEQWLDEDK
jgi:putative holliday junction resolvase